jgi:PAS domain S-box-containing protein
LLETSNLGLIEAAAHLALIAIQLDRSRKILERQEVHFRNEQELVEDELRAYKQAVEGLEEMIVVVDRDYRYLLANRTFLKMRNRTREQVLGRFARDVLNQGVFDETIKHRLDECFRGAIVRYEMKYTYPEIGERDVAVSYFPIEGSNGIDRAACIFSDITERKRAEARQRETEERFRLMADSAPVMIWMVGSDIQPVYFNQSWRDFTGRSLQEELQSGWATITHPDDIERCRKIVSEGFASRRPFSKECRLRRHDGEYRWILDTGVPRFLPDGTFTGFIGSCVDVTDQKAAQETLSHINRRLITAQEDERAWIARELHDDIHQRVGLLAMHLERMRQNPPSSTAEWERETASASAEVVELGKDIQALSYRLHSPKLEYLGLATAASAFCREFSHRERADVDFQSENVPRDLPADSSLCLFRILQEALQNALKHSGSRAFQVSLKSGSNDVELTVRDFGTGFRPEDAIKGPGLGLISMKERVSSLGGLLSVDSTLRRGTTIRARVPIGVRPQS